MLDNFYVKLLAVGVVVYGLYWLMSPYQNCMRESAGRISSINGEPISRDSRVGWCRHNTDW